MAIPVDAPRGCSGTSTVPAARLSPWSDSAPGRTGGSDRGSWNPKAPPAAERNDKCMGFGRVGGKLDSVLPGSGFHGGASPIAPIVARVQTSVAAA